jgi:hypothetical protein
MDRQQQRMQRMGQGQPMNDRQRLAQRIKQSMGNVSQEDQQQYRALMDDGRVAELQNTGASDALLRHQQAMKAQQQQQQIMPQQPQMQLKSSGTMSVPQQQLNMNFNQRQYEEQKYRQR